MAGLNLVPNEVVGYRIVPDWTSFNVQLVKRKGASSKEAGKEYGITLAYCRSLEFASDYIVQHATRVHGEENQMSQEALDGSVGSAIALAEAIVKAQAAAITAVQELQSRIDALGLSRKALVHALGESTDAPPVDEQQAA